MSDFWEDPAPPPEEDPSWILAAGNRAARLQPGLAPGELVRRLRRGARFTQTLAARTAGLQRSRVCEIEKGRADPRWSEVVALLRAVGCEPVLLASGKGWTPGVERWRRFL